MLIISEKKENFLTDKSLGKVLAQVVEVTQLEYQSDKCYYAQIDCPDQADYTKNTPFYFRFMVLPKREKQ